MGLPVIEVRYISIDSRDISPLHDAQLEASRGATGSSTHHIVCVWCSLFGDDVACSVMKPVRQ